MKPGLALLCGVMLALAAACDGGSEPADPLPTNEQGTPIAFEEVRDGLVDRLDAIGVSIGSVPPDVRQEILASCRQLEFFIERETADELCGAVQRAMDRDDPGTIDLVVDRLRQLEAE